MKGFEVCTCVEIATLQSYTNSIVARGIILYACIDFVASLSARQSDNKAAGKGSMLNEGWMGVFLDLVVDVLVGLNTAGDLLSDDRGNSLGVVVGVSLFLQLGSVLGDHVVLGLPGNLGQDVEFMLGVQNLLVNNGLNSMLVVVDVSLSVNGLDGLDLFTLLDVFLNDFRRGFRADLGAMDNRSGLSRMLSAVRLTSRPGWIG